MMFNFKKKKPKIRFYSTEPGVPDVFPVVPTSQIERSWLNLPNFNHDTNGDMWTKNCPGIKLIMNAGWVIPAPADFIIETNGDGIDFQWIEPIKFAHEKPPGNEIYIGFHDKDQSARLVNKKNTLQTVVKVNTPWRVEVSDDYLLLQMPVSYNNEFRFTSAQGILDPRYAHVLNIQLFWHETNSKTIIKAGTPLAQFIPIKRNEYISTNFDFSVTEATEKDKQKERAFNYALRCSELKYDTLKSRLKRVKSVLSKYAL